MTVRSFSLSSKEDWQGHSSEKKKKKEREKKKRGGVLFNFTDFLPPVSGNLGMGKGRSERKRVEVREISKKKKKDAGES